MLEYGRRQRQLTSLSVEERNALRRSQDLDRVLFHSHGTVQADDASSSLTGGRGLPPIRSSGTWESPDGERDSMEVSPVASSRRGNGVTNGGALDQTWRRNGKGGHHHHHNTVGASPSSSSAFSSSPKAGANPYESVVDATPSLRYGVRDWRMLELLPSTGATRQEVMALEEELAACLKESLAISAQSLGLPNTITSVPPPPALPLQPPSHQLEPPLQPSPQQHQQLQLVLNGGGATPRLVQPPPPPLQPPPAAALPVPFSAPSTPGRESNAKASTGGFDPLSPREVSMSSPWMDSPTEPPRPASSPMPATSAAAAAAGTAVAVAGTAVAVAPVVVTDPTRWAQQRSGSPPPLPNVRGAQAAVRSQSPPTYNLRASYPALLQIPNAVAAAGWTDGGSGGGGRGGEDEETGLLAGFIGHRHSTRRHAQVLSNWLDQALARTWQVHAPAVPHAALPPLVAASGGDVSGAPSPKVAQYRASPGRSMSPQPRAASPHRLRAPLNTKAHNGLSHQQAQLPYGALVTEHTVENALSPSSPPRVGMAARFAVAGSRSAYGNTGWTAEMNSHLVANPQLRRVLSNVVMASASNLVSHIAAGCWEDGAMLARLWNLNTALNDVALRQLKQENVGLAEVAHMLRQRVGRLDPLIDWTQEARDAAADMRGQLEVSSASLLLATRERDGLLRENDKIILYYKKEFRRFKQEQKKSAWRLAKKLKNTQEQLRLLQRDRAQLHGAVAISRTEAGRMVKLMEGVHSAFTTLSHSQSVDEDLLSDLSTIDHGLRTMTGGAVKIEEVNGKAEDTHFVNEEAMTKVAEEDDANDDLMEQILAEGDPDYTKRAAEADAEYEDAMAPMMETLSRPSSPPPDQLFSRLATSIARGKALGEEKAARASVDDGGGDEDGQRGKQRKAARSGVADVLDSEDGKMLQVRPRSTKSSTPSEAPKDDANDSEKPLSTADAEVRMHTPGGTPIFHPEMPGVVPPTPGGTGGGTPLGDNGQKAIEALKERHSAEISYALVSLGLDPAAASSAPDPMDGLVEGVKQRLAEVQRQLDARTTQQQQAETRLDVAADKIKQRNLEIQQVTIELQRSEARAEAVAAAHAALRQTLTKLGLNPDAPVLPEAPHPELSFASAAVVASLSPRVRAKKGALAAAATAAAAAVTAAAAAATATREEAEAAELADDFGAESEDVAELTEGEAEPRVARKLTKGAKGGKSMAAPKGRGGAGGGSNASPTRRTHSPPQGAARGSKGGAGKRNAAARASQSEGLGEDFGAATPTLNLGGLGGGAGGAGGGAGGGGGGGAGGGAGATISSWAADAAQATRASPTSPLMRNAPRAGDPASKLQLAIKAMGHVSEPADGFVATSYKRVEQQTGILRLQEAVSKFSDIKPRTIDWLIKLIDNVYRGKYNNDESRAKAGQEPLSMVDFLFYHLSGTYGTRDLVMQYSACVVACIEAYRKVDVRIQVFQRFLMQMWDIKTLSVFMDASRKLSEPARLPCCDFPTDYSSKKGEPTLVDVRKCLWVADKVLFRRGAEAALTFASALATKGEGITDQELNQFFVAPGYYGQDIANMRAYELGRAEFRRIQGAVFLEALCVEYVRCEAVMLDALPSIFKKFDRNDDGFMEMTDVPPMIRELALEPVSEPIVNEQAGAFWSKGMAVETEHTALTPAGLLEDAMRDSPRPGTSSSVEGRSDVKHLSYTSFMEACMRSDWVRAWVRLHRTPPAKLRLDNRAEEANRVLLYILVSRHWHLHGHAITSCFDQTGPVEPQLLQQATLFDREKDGARKALLLHTMLKLLVGRKLDKLLSQLTTEQLGQHVELDFEDSLDRLTRAVKVLYGGRCVLEDDLTNADFWASSGYTVQQERRRMIIGVLGVYNRLRLQMQNAAAQIIAHHFDIVFWMQRWRGLIQARKKSEAPAAASVKSTNRRARGEKDKKASSTAAAAGGRPAAASGFAAYVKQGLPDAKAAVAPSSSGPPSPGPAHSGTNSGRVSPAFSDVVDLTTGGGARMPRLAVPPTLGEEEGEGSGRGGATDSLAAGLPQSPSGTGFNRGATPDGAAGQASGQKRTLSRLGSGIRE